MIPDGATAPAVPDGPELRTARYSLRPLLPGDAGPIHRLVNDWAVVRMLSRLPFPYPRELTDEWIASTERQRLDGSAWHFGVIEPVATADPAPPAPGRLLGCVGLRLDRTTRSGHLGYWVGARYWNNGVAGEAASRVAHWALANLELDRLVAQVATDNPASARVLRRIGFREVGQGNQLFQARGGEHPVTLFEATHADLTPAPTATPPIPAPAPAVPAIPIRRILLVAACALVDAAGRVLLTRRPEGKPMAGLWEFPGGKMEPGETPEECLIREMREELGVELDGHCLAPFTFASHAYRDTHLLMPLFLCRRWSGTPHGRENQALAWVNPAELDRYPMPDADKPLVPLLRGFL